MKLIILALFAIAFAEKAPKVKMNPSDISGIAEFPSGFDQNVKGAVVFTADSGHSVDVEVDICGLPESGGPFLYHIHENPIPAEGNCDAAGGHLNPYDAPEDCSSQKNAAFCEVGDLSGKHGVINGTSLHTTYTDPYLSLNRKSKSFILGKSLVIHFANLTKVACANIHLGSDYKLEHIRKIKEEKEKEKEEEKDNEDNEEDNEENNEKDSENDREKKKSPYPSAKNGTKVNETTNSTNHEPDADYDNSSSINRVALPVVLAVVCGLLLL